LARLITDAIGDGWITDLDQLRKIESFVDDAVFRQRFRAVKLHNKRLLAAYVEREVGIRVSPESLFDVQVKRLHEYKRQLLLLLLHHCAVQPPQERSWPEHRAADVHH
jgi:glycogen phosphorylase